MKESGHGDLLLVQQRKQVEPISMDGKGATDTGPRNLAIDE
jgi:hypothetical protein